MPVLLPNTMLTAEVKTRPVARDPHGKPIVDTDAPPELRGPYPGHVDAPFDGEDSTNQWTIRADERMWELRPDDVLIDSEGRRFVIRSAKLEQLVGYPHADYIGVTADLDPPRVL